MITMKNLFDYIFYRVYRAYKKRDGAPEIYATNVLSLMQFFSVVAVFISFEFFLDFPFPSTGFFVVLILSLIGINWYLYGFRVDVSKFESRWGTEEVDKRKRRGWLVVVSLVALIMFPIVLGILRHNLVESCVKPPMS